MGATKFCSMTDILVIPDYHAHPDHDNDRAEWLGWFVVERQPDYVVNIGDFGDMPSLCSYEKGKRSFEGRRYIQDVEACRDALDRFDYPIRCYAAKKRLRKEKQYAPKRIALVGNHEDRIDRATSVSPELHGKMSMEDLGFEEYDWEVVPFKSYAQIGGMTFMHFLPNNLGNAVTSVTMGRALLQKNYETTVTGHSHLRAFAEDVSRSGQRRLGINVGCFVHPDAMNREHGWSCGFDHRWWNGVVYLSGVQDGYASRIEWIDQSELEREYSK